MIEAIALAASALFTAANIFLHFKTLAAKKIVDAKEKLALQHVNAAFAQVQAAFAHANAAVDTSNKLAKDVADVRSSLDQWADNLLDTMNTKITDFNAGVLTCEKSLTGIKTLAEDFAISAGMRADEAFGHATRARLHAIYAEGQAQTAGDHASCSAEHASVAVEHASKVGQLSQAVADAAAQANIRMVHRKDYSTEGSNVGGR